MAFINQAVTVLQTLVIALGAGLEIEAIRRRHRLTPPERQDAEAPLAQVELMRKLRVG